MPRFRHRLLSLGYLRRFPFDRLKIDQSFVRDLFVNSGSAAIVRALIGLGRGLSVGITAEGVENEAQLAFLSAEGCGTAQGFYLGRPMTPRALATRLQQQESRDAPPEAPAVGAWASGLAEAPAAFAPGGGGQETELARALGLAPGSPWLETLPGGSTRRG
jgi:predicted signal transduction protein with EAL and GGDEF domain